jgi:hypothetical protein
MVMSLKMKFQVSMIQNDTLSWKAKESYTHMGFPSSLGEFLSSNEPPS